MTDNTQGELPKEKGQNNLPQKTTQEIKNWSTVVYIKGSSIVLSGVWGSALIFIENILALILNMTLTINVFLFKFLCFIFINWGKEILTADESLVVLCFLSNCNWLLDNNKSSVKCHYYLNYEE